jgi:hypothetical protein
MASDSSSNSTEEEIIKAEPIEYDDPKITFDLINSFELKKGVRLITSFKDCHGLNTKIIGFSETGTIFLDGQQNLERVSDLLKWAIAQGAREGIRVGDDILLYGEEGIIKYEVAGFYLHDIVELRRGKALSNRQIDLETLLKTQVLSEPIDVFEYNFKINDCLYDSKAFHGAVHGFFRNDDVLLVAPPSGIKRVNPKDLKHVITNL